MWPMIESDWQNLSRPGLSLVGTIYSWWMSIYCWKSRTWDLNWTSKSITEIIRFTISIVDEASFSSQLTTNILQSFRFITFIFLIDSNIETPLLGVDLCMYSWRISSGPRGRRRIYTSIIISCLDFLFLVTF